MPKILPDDVPMRTVVRDTQLAEQLVVVPTIVSFVLAAADYGAERRHSSSWSWRVKRWSSRFSSLNRVQQRRILLRIASMSGLWSRSLTSPVLVEAFKVSPRTEFILFFALSSWCS